MKPIDGKKDKVTIRAVSHNEEGRKIVEKTELKTRNIDTIKYVVKKHVDKGCQGRERHPIDGLGIGQPPPKSGHGGKYTWEGPGDMTENELDPVPAAIDERDPNYVDEEEEERIVKGEEADVAEMVVKGEEADVEEMVVGEVEVAKAAENREGVARIEVDPKLGAQP